MITGTPNLQFMSPSKRPVQSLVRNLAEQFFLDNEKRPSKVEMEKFEDELDLCRKLKCVDLPATTMKAVEETSQTKKLVCEGYTLTNR